MKHSKEFKAYSQIEALEKVMNWKLKLRRYFEIRDIKFRVDKETQMWICFVIYE